MSDLFHFVNHNFPKESKYFTFGKWCYDNFYQTLAYVHLIDYYYGSTIAQ